MTFRSHLIIWRVLAIAIAIATPQRPPKTHYPAAYFPRRIPLGKLAGRSRSVINHKRPVKLVNRVCQTEVRFSNTKVELKVVGIVAGEVLNGDED